jgi:hypothetical protein
MNNEQLILAQLIRICEHLCAAACGSDHLAKYLTGPRLVDAKSLTAAICDLAPLAKRMAEAAEADVLRAGMEAGGHDHR